MEVVPLLFQPAGEVHFRPPAVSANRTAEQIKKRKQDRMYQLSCVCRTIRLVPLSSSCSD